jgi:hypothetical protein
MRHVFGARRRFQNGAWKEYKNATVSRVEVDGIVVIPAADEPHRIRRRYSTEKEVAARPASFRNFLIYGKSPETDFPGGYFLPIKWTSKTLCNIQVSL